MIYVILITKRLVSCMFNQKLIFIAKPSFIIEHNMLQEQTKSRVAVEAGSRSRHGRVPPHNTALLSIVSFMLC